MTTPLTLDRVCDLDIVASRNPLALDVSTTARYVYGAEAIAQRVLGEWADYARLLDLEGTMSEGERFILRSRLAALAEGVPFVNRATVSVTADDAGTLTIAATLYLEDDTTEQLEVSVTDAAVALAESSGFHQ